MIDSLSELDPDNVYWFVAPTDELSLEHIRSASPDIHIIAGDLPSAIETALESNPALVASKQAVLELDDLAVTVSGGEGRRVITFRAAELREFRRHLAILPDLAQRLKPHDTSQRKQEFVSFLSKPRQVPDWDGIGEGFTFERDAYKQLLAAVLRRVGVMTGAAQHHHGDKRTGQDGPIFIAGPPASGRTVGLLWLGYQLRQKGIFTVHLVPSGGTVDIAAIEQIIRLAEAERGLSRSSVARQGRPARRG